MYTRPYKARGAGKAAMTQGRAPAPSLYSPSPLPPPSYQSLTSPLPPLRPSLRTLTLTHLRLKDAVNQAARRPHLRLRPPQLQDPRQPCTPTDVGMATVMTARHEVGERKCRRCGCRRKVVARKRVHTRTYGGGKVGENKCGHRSDRGWRSEGGPCKAILVARERGQQAAGGGQQGCYQGASRG